MEQLVFDIKPEESTFYNFTTEIPRSWRDLQYYSIPAGVSVPFYHRLTIKKILTISTNNFYKLKNSLSIDRFKDHILPMAVRYITKDNVYVVERPPFQLEVDYRLGGAFTENSKMPPVKIWVPWTVMVFSADSLMNGNFNNVQLYFNSGPLDSLDQPLVTCFYPNTHSDARICFSTSLNDFNNILDISQIEQGNIGYIYNYVFNNYMMGGWNSDLSQNLFQDFRNVDRSIIKHKCPTLNLFFNPTSDAAFFKKLSLVFPKKYFGKLKRYYLDKVDMRTISREKCYSRNFGIFAAFTLEQTIDFIKELQYLMSFKESYNRFTIDNILKNYHLNYFDADNFSNSGVGLVTRIIDPSVQYDYLQCKVDLFIINDKEHDPRSYTVTEALLPLDILSKINYELMNFLNTRQPDEQIAFVYDYSSKTFDVVLNYDSKEYIKNLILSVHNGISQYCENNPSKSNTLPSWLINLDQRIEQYQQLTAV